MQLQVQQKALALGDTYDVTDAAGNLVFKVKSRLISPVAHKKYIKDARSGKTLMTLKRKFFSWGKTYIVKSSSGEKKAKINQPPFSFKLNLNISGYGNNLAVQGELFSANWTLFEDGAPVGSVSKTFQNAKDMFVDRYFLDVVNPQDAAFFTTVVIAVDNMRYNGGK